MFTMLRVNPVRLRKGSSKYDPSSGWHYIPTLFCMSFRWTSRAVERGPRADLHFRYELHTFYFEGGPSYQVFKGADIPKEDLKEASLEFLEGYLKEQTLLLSNLKKASRQVARDRKKDKDPEAHIWKMREGDLHYKTQACQAMLKKATSQKALLESGHIRKAYPEELNRTEPLRGYV